MKGRWAAGIVPRNFAWIVEGRLAVSERPGGSAPHHRRVRRQEEILWLRGQGFTRIVSLLPSNHNLHSYEEFGLAHAHFPIPSQSDPQEALGELYFALLGWIRSGELVLLHQEELGERVAGVMAGFLCWSGVLPEPPRAISAVEQILHRQMGAAGRSVAVLAPEITLRPPETLGSSAGASGPLTFVDLSLDTVVPNAAEQEPIQVKSTGSTRPSTTSGDEEAAKGDQLETNTDNPAS